jgi:hypothetical protein
VREALTVCLERLEQWGALTRHEDTYTFIFVTGDFFEVVAHDVAQPSITLLELIHAVYEDHINKEEQNNFLHATTEALSTFAHEVAA